MKIVLMIGALFIFGMWMIFLAMHGDYYFPAPDSKALLRDELFRLNDR